MLVISLYFYLFSTFFCTKLTIPTLLYNSTQTGNPLLFSVGQRHRIDLELIKLFHQRMKLSDINYIIGFFPLLSCGVQSGAVVC